MLDNASSREPIRGRHASCQPDGGHPWLQAAQQSGEHGGRKVACRLLQEGRLASYEAVRSHSAALHFARNSSYRWSATGVQDDRKLALRLVQHDGLALQHVHPAYQDDYEVAMAAVRQNGWAFRYASPALRADRELVAVAVEAHGRNLMYVSDGRLRSDHELLLRCIKKNAWALQWASDTVRLDRAFLLRAVEANGWALPFAHASHLNAPYRDSHALVAAAAKQGASPSFRGRRRAWSEDLMVHTHSGTPFGKGGHDSLLPPRAAVDGTASRLGPLPSSGHTPLKERWAPSWELRPDDGGETQDLEA